MSDITGNGYGYSHDWKRLYTEQVGATPDRLSKVTYYRCRKCGEAFNHHYDVIEDIFKAIEESGIPENCTPKTGLKNQELKGYITTVNPKSNYFVFSDGIRCGVTREDSTTMLCGDSTINPGLKQWVDFFYYVIWEEAKKTSTSSYLGSLKIRGDILLDYFEEFTKSQSQKSECECHCHRFRQEHMKDCNRGECIHCQPSQKETEECRHKNFEVHTIVNRFEDMKSFNFEARVRCSECQKPFQFMGLGAGLSFKEPMVSADALELRAPIQPENIKKIAAKMQFSMPPEPEKENELLEGWEKEFDYLSNEMEWPGKTIYGQHVPQNHLFYTDERGDIEEYSTQIAIDPDKVKKYIEKLLEAQAKKSFREGWEEQKKKDAVIVARIQAGVCSRIPSNQKTIELLDEARRKILNQL